MQDYVLAPQNGTHFYYGVPQDLKGEIGQISAAFNAFGYAVSSHKSSDTGMDVTVSGPDAQAFLHLDKFADFTWREGAQNYDMVEAFEVAVTQVKGNEAAFWEDFELIMDDGGYERSFASYVRPTKMTLNLQPN